MPNSSKTRDYHEPSFTRVAFRMTPSNDDIIRPNNTRDRHCHLVGCILTANTHLAAWIPVVEFILISQGKLLRKPLLNFFIRQSITCSLRTQQDTHTCLNLTPLLPGGVPRACPCAVGNCPLVSVKRFKLLVCHALGCHTQEQKPCSQVAVRFLHDSKYHLGYCTNPSFKNGRISS